MEIDGAGSSPIYDLTVSEPGPEPEPPPSEPPPAYEPPRDGVDWSTSGSSSSVDSSAAAWAEGTIAAAEAYAAMAPRENEFAEKTAEQRAQDAFWEHDPNRPGPAAPPPPAPAVQEEDDLNLKHPGLKPEGPPPETGPAEPLPSEGNGPTPPHLRPTPPPPPPPWLAPPPPPAPAPTPSPVTNVSDLVTKAPVHPTYNSAPDGGHVIGIASNPKPEQPKPVDPSAPKPPNTYP